MSALAAPPTRYRMYGLNLSYFTGKLEAYFRAKGIAYDYVEMDLADFRRCARATGIAQMPQVACPDGTWLTDTTAIIARFEAELPTPRLHPTDPSAWFVSLLLEDMFDEWLWRPALYYRWAFSRDARLMSEAIARSLLRDVPGPFEVKRQFILARQRREYLNRDGVTRTTAPALERLYLRTLDMLEPILASRPFLLGERPCEADFGLFGPFFRHFSIDPTPAAILRERAPAVYAWTGRLWAARPETLAQTPELTTAPADVAGLINMAGTDYLPYLAANAEAVAAGGREVTFTCEGATFAVPPSRYRAGCLARLQAAFQVLPPTPARDALSTPLGQGAHTLRTPLTEGSSGGVRPGSQTPFRDPARRPLDRHLC